MGEQANMDAMKILADMIANNTIFCTKEVLTCEEAAQYLGISKSYLYKLTMRGDIPHSKPNGKMCYFKRTELEQWMMRNPCATVTDINDRANRYLNRPSK